MTRTRACNTVWIALLLAACTAESKSRPPTEILLRLEAAAWLASQGDQLQVATYVERAEGAWAMRDSTRLDLTGLDWPIDVPIIRAAGENPDASCEIIVDLRQDGSRIAQARAIARFVPNDQRLLVLRIERCDEPRPVCEVAESCHGTSCEVCIDSKCQAVESVDGTHLPALVPDAEVIEQADASGVDKPAPDASDGVDAYADHENERDSASPDLDSGVPDAAEDVAVVDAADRDSPLDVIAPVPEAAVECERPTRCTGRVLESCSHGVWTALETCPGGCVGAACVPCEPTNKRCAGSAALTPERCSEAGQWEPARKDDGSLVGECQFACTEGICHGECDPSRPMQCSPNQDNVRVACTPDAVWGDSLACAALCRDGSCVNPPSCGSATGCRGNQSCCVSRRVPGGRFKRSFDKVLDTDDTFDATLSPYRLDRFEVTVGRFQKWVDVYGTAGSLPSAGSGRNPNNPSDIGWKTEWDQLLPSTKAALEASFATCDGAPTRKSDGSGRSDMPLNCVNWYLAQAFCIWDGGRLPTEAEWNFAAAGGELQRVYPWSDPATSQEIDAARALTGAEPLVPVGSRSPQGDGLWGHADLAGSLAEWVQDYFAWPYATTDCTDCADFTVSPFRSLRGGSFGYDVASATASYRDSSTPATLKERIGFRCARSP